MLFKTTIIILITHSFIPEMILQLQVLPVCPRVEVIARCAVRHVPNECETVIL